MYNNIYVYTTYTHRCACTVQYAHVKFTCLIFFKIRMNYREKQNTHLKYGNTCGNNI